jgi:hypothetical protein
MIRQFIIAVLLTLAPIAHAQDITGDWTGRYICNQGVTALNLVIQKTAGTSAITATFSFGPPPENPEVPKGSYVMRGSYDQKARRVVLKGDRWLDRPSGYEMVGLDGHVVIEGDKIAGRVPDMFGCTDFEVRRTAPLIG